MYVQLCASCFVVKHVPVYKCFQNVYISASTLLQHLQKICSGIDGKIYSIDLVYCWLELLLDSQAAFWVGY